MKHTIREPETLIGLKVVSVDRQELKFEDGTTLEYHPYETYIYGPPVNKD